VDSHNIPYQVTDVKHDVRMKQDGTLGGQYNVTIKHGSGVVSSFTVDEGPNAAREAHANAIRQVEQAQQIKALPAGEGGGR
jgi:hypothetical protein